ncbi:MAG: universal stress protein [Pseudomonadota bacterium]
MKTPYTVVVGIDYSEVSRLALRQALEIASGRVDSELHVIHVETPPWIPGHGTEPLTGPDHGASKSASDRDLDEALQRLHRLVVHDVTEFEESRIALGSAPIARVVSHVRANATSHEIAQLAMDLEADLLVVGTHGRTGIARFLLGSVAHALVTLAPCPVLVVRPKRVSLVPVIEPPCPRCVEARRESGGLELWCEQHRALRNRRHTYYQDDRSGEETNFPLVFAGS